MDNAEYVDKKFSTGLLTAFDAVCRGREHNRRSAGAKPCGARVAFGVATVLAVAAAILLSAASVAGAAYTHEPLFQLGEEIPATGPHGEAVAQPGPLGKMESMAVDSGHLWVAEGEFLRPSRIDEFDAETGAFVAQPVALNGPDTGYGYGYGEGIAIGHGTGEGLVYVAGQTNDATSISVLNEAGALKATWLGHTTPAGSFPTVAPYGYEIGTISDVAVDNSSNPLDAGSGNVFVAVSNFLQGVQSPAIEVFHPEADGAERYVGEITGVSPSEPFVSAQKIAVDETSGDLLVEDSRNGHPVIDVFEPTGLGGYTFVRQLTGPPPSGSFESIGALAADGGNGEIYVATYAPPPEQGPVIDEFSAAGSYLGHVENIPSSTSSIAVESSSHDLYARRQAYGPDVVVPDVTTAAVANLKPESATLSGTVNADGAGSATCGFDWGTSPALGKVAPCPNEIKGIAGEGPVPVQVTLSGLERGVTYYYRLQAGNAAGTNPGEAWQDESFTTPGALLRGESVEDVSATAATMQATIDPNQTPTSYYFEYGPSAEYGQRAPAPPGEALGSGTLDLEPSLRLQALAPGTVYHYRVVVVNELKAGEFEALDGEDHTFTTQPATAPLALPDGRSWEMVSQPNKLGALILSAGPGAVQASVNGDAIAYQTSSPTESEPQGYPTDVTVLSRRDAAGWSSQDISPPHDQESGVQESGGGEFRLFSRDLSLAAVVPVTNGFTPLSPEATESTTYLRTDYPEGDVGDPCNSSCYRPLVTAADTPPGTVFGEEPRGECPWRSCGPRFRGASGDLQHVVVASPVQLTSTPAPAGGEEGLYEWSAGHLQLVGAPPQGEEVPVTLAGERNPATGVRHAVSEDGERVILQGGGALYLRDVGAGDTIRLDVPQGGTGPSSGASYMTASSDASRIFFLDGGHLTAQSSASGEDLYEYDLNAPSGARLSDLTVDPNQGEAAEVTTVIGASEDGSYVYFLAYGALAAGSRSGALNLYVRHAGATKLIATLSSSDRASFYREHLFARVSPSGGWLAFMSSADLTGYDTRDAVTGQPDAEVYLYGAGAGKLVCASCDPSGARPVGLQVNGESGRLVAKGNLSNTWVAANVVPWQQLTDNSRSGGHEAMIFYQPHYLSDSGRLFFDSADALVPDDVNGTEDVYEYEPVGVGDCDSASQMFASRADGCVGLISSGASPVESAFLDASESGGDVFFLTQARLVTQDYDTAYDLYDAHECTEAAPCVPTPPAQPPECETEASCRAAPSPQPALYGAPASATFSGTGNLATPATPATKPKAKPKPKAKARCGKRKAKRCPKKAKPAKKAKPGKGKRATAGKSRRGGNR
ncbi:MAG TPA: hypothetical protein VNV42_00495 [Solirubrobacteraceae bacterium]|nr:hypothetical protein [Solirubrobacteraceae bacterium]